jgi:hypothetical protein
MKVLADSDHAPYMQLNSGVLAPVGTHRILQRAARPFFCVWRPTRQCLT